MARDAALLAFVLFDVVYLVMWSPGLAFAYDAQAYWGLDLAHLYDIGARSLTGEEDAYRYSPAFAQAVLPLSLLSWPAFVALWTAFIGAVTVIMGGRRWWIVALLPVTLLELWAGNVHLLMAAVVVFGFRYPGLWAFMAFTKVTPFVGVLWFAFRGEWRKLGIALGVTALLTAISFVLAPGLWAEWIALLVKGSQWPSDTAIGPLWLRLGIALPLLAYAARTDRKWLLPVVVTLALPNIWLHSLAILAAWVPLSRRRLP